METLRRTIRPLARAVREASAHVHGLAQYVSGLPAAGTAHVSYGHTRLPRADEAKFGGIVKLQALADAFPAAPFRFNLLYLVSSALPEGAVALARYAQRKHAKVVLNQNGVAYPAWHGPGWEQVNAPMAALLHRADYVFYQSAFCERGAARFLGARSGASEILHNAVDTRRFTPQASAPARRPLRLLLGGSHMAWYRVETALQVLGLVARQRPDVELLIAGRLGWLADEAEALRIAQKAAALLRVGDRVRFLGRYTQKDAVDLFRQADVLLHTKYNDPCPTVVLEAMACGLPVVYSRSGGVPELVGEDAGIGIPSELSWERDIPPDPQAMATAVLEVAGAIARFAEAARQRAVDAFDLEPWIRRHAEVFESLVA